MTEAEFYSKEAEKFLIENRINDVVTNPQEKNSEKWIYVSDVLALWFSQPNKTIDQIKKR